MYLHILPVEIITKGQIAKIDIDQELQIVNVILLQVFLHPEMGLAEGRLVLPLLGTLITAMLSYRFVETPFLTPKSSPRPGAVRPS